MRFRMLGPLEVLSPNGWTAVGAAKWRSLLACMLVRPGQLLPTESLIDELWGDNPPPTANNLVSIYVHRLKKLIGDSEGRLLVYRAPGYMLRVAPGDLDLEQFESLAAKGAGALAAGQPERAAALLGQALELWRGPLLADVQQTALLATHADRLFEFWLTATELRMEADLACAGAVQVIPELRGLVLEHPLRERMWALLMRALEDAGRRAEALETYAQARQVISDELGVDPGSELRQLYAQLLAADASSPQRPAASQRRPRADAESGAAPAGDAARVARPDGGAGPRPGAAAAADLSDDPAGDPELSGSIAIGTFAESAPGEAVAEAAAMLGASTGSSPGIPRPAQLPADIGDFTGREAHVDHLCALLTGAQAGTSPGAVRIAVVNGAGGLGKTTLAVHVAHQVSARFPDGQLYVDLLGASSQPSPPGEVLARFLHDLGIEGNQIPAQDEARAALFRSILTGRRVLIVLDNAKDAAQVRPLLPGSSSCAVLVTTRNRTSDLASMRFFDLDVLEDTEALALFSRIVGEQRAAAEPDATAEILVACAGLPLAIRICAARLAKRRQWRISTLADRLRNQHRRLDELKTGDLAVRASFQVSYDALRSAASGGLDPARVFRLLGLWQGASISGVAAAALVGAPEDDIAEALEALVDVNLLESPTPDWYRFHDLLRVYATERALAEESESARGEAVGRLLQWYLDSAQAAADTLSPLRYQVPGQHAAGAHPHLTFATSEDVFTWYGDERANIVAATRQAAAVGLHDTAWRLPPTLFPVFNRTSNWVDCISTHRIALDSARKAGDRPGEAWARNQLGFALGRVQDAEAFVHLEQALVIRRETGDARGEAQTAISLGAAHLIQHGPGADALRYHQLAVSLLTSPDSLSLRAVALNNLGDVHFDLGDLASAEACYAEAYDICREIGGHVEGHALNNLGRVYHRMLRHDEAVASLGAALGKHHASGDLLGEATTLKHLGEVYIDIGHSAKASAFLSDALLIFQRIGEKREAAKVAELLDSLASGHVVR